MPTINRYQDISEIDREAKRDYIDRHSPFVICEESAKKGEKFCVKVRVGNEYSHPDDFDHYIQSLQLFDGETFLAQTIVVAGTLGNNKSQLEIDFYIVPQKSKLKLIAHAYCTKHGIWESTPVEVSVTE